MEQFTQANIRKMSEEMVAVLNKYGFKNVTFNGGGSRYSPNECTFKVVGKINGTNSRAEDELEYHAKVDGININKVGPKGEKLIEFHPRKRKYPYIYVSRTGKRFKCTRDSAQRMFIN